MNDTTQYYNLNDTICAISSPSGTGAIALVRLSGPDAFAIADSIWQGKALAEAKSHTAHLGEIVDPEDGSILDQAVATVYVAPRSFTGDNMVEFGIHGSRWIQRRLISLLNRQGARLALPGEFTRRAFASGRLDLAEAEAVADMIAASSKAAHTIAVSQMRGEFSKHIAQLRDKLIELASLLELELDFSEEDVEFASRQRLLELADSVHDRLSRLASTFDAGTAIKDGVPVAIIGPTNAGKSSLLNALLGDDRAIVSDIHGTTRDIVEDTLEIGPYLIRFRDTAGLRNTTDTIENIGIDRSRHAARTATIVLFVLDPSAMPGDAEIVAETEGINPQNIVFVVNKNDINSSSNIAATTHLQAVFGQDVSIISISAKDHSGLNELRTTITDKIERLTPGSDSDIIITNARHAEALRAAAQSAEATAEALRTNLPPDLVAQDLRETIHHLSTITGQITTTDILTSIFSNFCIGK